MPSPDFDPIAEARRQWEAHWEGAPVAQMAALTSIFRAQQLLLARLNELLAPFDLTFARYEALMLLSYSRRGELPLGKISDRLQVHRASVTNVVDRLAERGYVERVPHTSDRRAVLARITAEGRRAARAATEVLHEADMAMAPLSAGDCERLYALLRPLRAAEDGFDGA